MKTPIMVLLVLIVVLVMDKLSDKSAKVNHTDASETEQSVDGSEESWTASMEAVNWNGHFRMGERKLFFEVSKRLPDGQDRPYITISMGN